MRIVTIGAGVVGTTLTQYFAKEGHDVVVIDRDPAMIRRIVENLDAQGIEGDASDHRVLQSAGLASAQLVLAVTDSDESNIIITLMVQAKNPQARIITRVRGEHYTSNRDLWSGQRFSNTLVISPERAAAAAVNSLLTVDRSFEVVPFLDGAIRVAGFFLEGTSPLVGKTLQDACSDPKTRSLVVAVVRGDDVLIPSGHHLLQAGDRIYLMLPGGHKPVQFAPLLGQDHDRSPRTVLVGGGWQGLRMAQTLEEQGLPPVVVEKDLARCQVLASRLPKSVIIHGNGTATRMLAEVGVANANLVTVTGHEEVNFLVALLGVKLGVKRAIAVMDNEDYLAMATSMGIHATVSPKLAAVRDILRFLNRDKVLDAAPMLDGRLDALMVELPAARITGRPLKEVGLPPGIMVAAVVRRGETLIPNGATLLAPGDKVLIITRRNLHPKLDAFISMDFS